MRGVVLMALVEARVVVWSRRCACRGDGRGRNHQSRPSQTPARCQVNQRLEHSSGWAPDMKSSYLAEVSATLNSRIPSLQVSSSNQVTGWRTMTLAHKPLPPPHPLHGTRIHRYTRQVPLKNVNATSPAKDDGKVLALPNTD